MKKSIAFILTLVLLVGTFLPISAFAQGESFKLYYSFDKDYYEVGDTVTAKLHLDRTDSSDNYNIYSFEGGVLFNPLYLEYKDSSANTNNAESFRIGAVATHYNENYYSVSVVYHSMGTSTPISRSSNLVLAELQFTAKAGIKSAALINSSPNLRVGTTGTMAELNAVDGNYTIGNPKAPSYAISFAGGDGAKGTAPVVDEKAAGDVFRLPDCTFTRDDYTFSGWSDGAKSYKAGDTFTMPDKAVTFTAQWDKVPVQHSAAFDGNGATGGSAPAKMNYYAGNKLSIPTQATLTRTDYTFNGWSYGGTVYQPGDTMVMPDKDVTFNATWKSVETGEVVGDKNQDTEDEENPKDAEEPKTDPGDETMNGFTDVKSDAYYSNAVQWAVEKGITKGTTATTFSPDMTCNRAQTVTFLWRAMGSPEPTAKTNVFTDVATEAYYYKAVLWAVEKGITKGTSATTFSPDDTVTRAQVAAFQWRAAGSTSASTANPFTDVAADAYYYNAVLWAAENGITTGTSATTFAPADGCTRGQIVTFLYRQLGK